MINSILANDSSELEKLHILSSSKNLFKNGIIDEDQWNAIKEDYKTNIYSPPFFIKLPLFIISSLGLLFGFGLISLSFGFDGIQILALTGGIGLIFLTEKIFIQSSFHFSSGVTEAGIYFGFSCLAFGLFGIDNFEQIFYIIIGFLFTSFIAVRYLDLVGLVAAILTLGGIFFNLAFIIGGLAEALLPFIIIGLYASVFYLSIILQKKLPQTIFENHFIITKSLSLILIYLAGNYFVVRELSIELMGLQLDAGEDIPFSFLFYFITILVPGIYFYIGVKKRSLLFIRVGSLTAILTVLTFYNYFLSAYTIYISVLTGIILILGTFFLFKKLKLKESGYTSEKLLDDSWASKEVTTIIASRITKEGSNIDTKKNSW
ncbi:MAG: hypothetical protein BalsKO_09370 [Balneolaceae bacterium]